MNDLDADLVQQARGGSRDAFSRLLTRHAPAAQKICARALRTPGGLEDVMQEAALQAWLGLSRLRDARQFGAWLAGIALNVARGELRHARREPVSWEELSGGRLVLEPLDTGPSPAELVELSDFSSAVRAAVAELPTGQRQAVLLVYLGGLSYRETAAVLGIEIGTVKTRLHKGRGNLQDRLRTLWMEQTMTTIAKQQKVLMRVADVRRRSAQEGERARSVVLLEEVDGARQLPIWVGHWESGSIAILLENVKIPRPQTHAFAASLLRAGGVTVDEVHIHRLADETFYSQVVLQSGADKTAVDARPSDSIALALELNAPIYVASEVLEEAIAARATRGLGDPSQSTIGAAEIVDHIIEHWPSEWAKPSR